MRIFISLFLSFLPSFIHVNIRRLLGQKIGKGTKLRFGTIIVSQKVQIGSKCKIGPFVIVRSQELEIGANSSIKPFVILKTRVINIKNYVQISSFNVINSEFTISSKFVIDDHSSIFPMCWIEPGEGVFIGKNVGVGGHTLMFTHGSWPNYLDGGPISFGSIVIEDKVWLPWRVFILPNVTIGKGAVIGGNSLINKNVEAGVLAAGSPAKVISKMKFDSSHKQEKLKEVLKKFKDHYEFKVDEKLILSDESLIFDKSKIVINEFKDLVKNDLLIVIDKTIDDKEKTILLEKGIVIFVYNKMTVQYSTSLNKENQMFISFLRKFGIRLYEN